MKEGARCRRPLAAPAGCDEAGAAGCVAAADGTVVEKVARRVAYRVAYRAECHVAYREAYRAAYRVAARVAYRAAVLARQMPPRLPSAAHPHRHRRIRHRGR